MNKLANFFYIIVSEGRTNKCIGQVALNERDPGMYREISDTSRVIFVFLSANKGNPINQVNMDYSDCISLSTMRLAFSFSVICSENSFSNASQSAAERDWQRSSVSRTL